VVATGEIICTPPPCVAKGKAASTPSRHIKRREGSTSEHSVERTTSLVAKRNLEGSGNSSNSILSFSNEHIADHITSIGISMRNETKNVQSSILLIKNVEKGRSGLTISHKVHELEELDDTDCDFDHETLNHLCGDLIEEEMDIAVTDHPLVSKLHKLRKSKTDNLSNSSRKIGTKKKIRFQRNGSFGIAEVFRTWLNMISYTIFL
jgi:hypothetical protein